MKYNLKKRMISFLKDFLQVAGMTFKILGWGSLMVGPILLGCLINPWWFLSLLLTFPLAVTYLIRM